MPPLRQPSRHGCHGTFFSCGIILRKLQVLRREHQSIIAKAAVLGGLCRLVRTREDAHEARFRITEIDAELVAHLAAEDTALYAVLINAQDQGLRILGAEAFEGVGGLLQVWVRFRDHWTATAILADPRSFATATDRMLRALSLRIEMEEDSLYPAAEAQARLGGRFDSAA